MNRFRALRRLCLAFTIAALTASAALVGSVPPASAGGFRQFVGIDVTANGLGYLLGSTTGETYAFGSVKYQGNPTRFDGGIAGVSTTADGQGYIQVSTAGQVYAYGSARSWGNPTGFAGQIAGISLTADGQGYVVVSSAGQVYAYGSARSWGNPTGFAGQIAGISLTADGQGYVVVSSAGQVYAYGSARSWGNPTGFAGQIAGISLTADGQGYVVVSSAGQVYAYGSARSWGNPTGFAGQIAGISLTADGQGYAVVSSTGQVYAYNVKSWGNGDPGTPRVTSDMIAQVWGIRSAKVDQGLPSLNAAMQDGGISTVPRIAAFLTTVRAESGFAFDALEGGCASRSYAPYCGRGFIQLTLKSNYQNAGAYLGRDLVANVDDARSLAYSASIARWYWTVSHNLNAPADQLNMGAVTRGVVGSGVSSATLKRRCDEFKAVLGYYHYDLQGRSVTCS